MNFKYLGLIIVLMVSCTNKEAPVTLIMNGHKLEIEVANTDEERAKGLMYRDAMDSNHGMIFIFDKEQKVSFWMKNTKIPLSIAYIDKKGTIQDLFDMNPYSLEPIESTRSSILYALEVNRGYFKRMNIHVGDILDLTPIINYSKSSK